MNQRDSAKQWSKAKFGSVIHTKLAYDLEYNAWIILSSFIFGAWQCVSSFNVDQHLLLCGRNSSPTGLERHDGQ